MSREGHGLPIHDLVLFTEVKTVFRGSPLIVLPTVDAQCIDSDIDSSIAKGNFTMRTLRPLSLFVRLTALAGLLTGCAELPPPPAPTPKAPVLVPYDQTADTMHVRTPSVAHRTEHRGGAAIRQEADIHVLWNTHAEAPTNPERLKAWQREMDEANGTAKLNAPAGRDISIYAKSKQGGKP